FVDPLGEFSPHRDWTQVNFGRDLLDAWLCYMAKNVEFRGMELPHDFVCERLESLFIEYHLAWLGRIWYLPGGRGRQDFRKGGLTACNGTQSSSKMLYGRSGKEGYCILL